jgi:hypothetical protein
MHSKNASSRHYIANFQTNKFSSSQRATKDWFNTILETSQPIGEAMPVDYEIYADGEALLGWLNATVRVTSENPINPNTLIRDIAAQIQSRLNNIGAEIAHLKMTLSPDAGLGDIAAISLVRNDFVPELSLTLQDEVTSGQLVLNLRAEAAPELLNDAVTSALQNQPNVKLEIEHREFFRPGKPQPTHRDAILAAEAAV